MACIEANLRCGRADVYPHVNEIERAEFIRHSTLLTSLQYLVRRSAFRHEAAVQPSTEGMRAFEGVVPAASVLQHTGRRRTGERMGELVYKQASWHVLVGAQPL